MGRRGFTLLELLMVVIIIAILASVALPQYIRATEKARAAEALSYLGALRSAELRYAATSATNVYTAVVTELDIDLPATMQFWTTPPTITASSGAGGTKGMATVPRSGGNYSAQTIGITFGTGTVCGTFVPYFGSAAVTCTAN